MVKFLHGAGDGAGNFSWIKDFIGHRLSLPGDFLQIPLK